MNTNSLETPEINGEQVRAVEERELEDIDGGGHCYPPPPSFPHPLPSPGGQGGFRLPKLRL